MRCANPNCRAVADDLLKGTLRLVEFETAPDERLLYRADGFPVCVARTKYFWLCPTCSRMFTIAKWNSSGLILERHPGSQFTPISIGDRKPVSQERATVHQPAARLYGDA